MNQVPKDYPAGGHGVSPTEITWHEKLERAWNHYADDLLVSDRQKWGLQVMLYVHDEDGGDSLETNELSRKVRERGDWIAWLSVREMWPRRRIEKSSTYKALQRFWEPHSNFFLDVYPRNWRLRRVDCEEVAARVGESIENDVETYAVECRRISLRRFLQQKYEDRERNVTSTLQRFEVAFYAKVMQYLNDNATKVKFENNESEVDAAIDRLKSQFRSYLSYHHMVLDLNMEWRPIMESPVCSSSAQNDALPSAREESEHAREADTTRRRRRAIKRQRSMQEPKGDASQPVTLDEESDDAMKDADPDTGSKWRVWREGSAEKASLASINKQSSTSTLVSEAGATQGATDVIAKPFRQSAEQEAKEFVKNSKSSVIVRPSYVKDLAATAGHLKDEIAKNMEQQLSSSEGRMTLALKEVIVDAFKELQAQVTDTMQENCDDIQRSSMATEQEITKLDAKTASVIETLAGLGDGSKAQTVYLKELLKNQLAFLEQI
ncbi:hypothetical protein HIM_05695 [Hirsutella minnesotensis 3608]|uniref:Uncharacterized protein n=1 Tax=Hirsutella minnesotensis 3608 TaxID=1043627 RepID=A0A0F8A5A0_9HYPO|nr:hypothetical protein HIM_05695 [Hirsutella minnesotensis 3608]